MNITPAVVLAREDFRERDERVIFYTRNYGKVSVIAKGARRIEAKLRGRLDIFNVLDIAFLEGAKFAILTGVNTKENFSNIGKTPHSYKAALSAVSIISSIFEERLPDPLFFDKIYYFLAKADNCFYEADCWGLLKDFQIEILDNQGYKIDFVQNRPSELESSLAEAFFYNFGYKPHTWLPTF